MFIRVKERANGKKSVQIVESYRRGDKVQQKIIRHVGQAVSDAEVEVLRKLGESIIVETENNRQPVLPLLSPEYIYGGKKAKKETDDTVKVKDLREEQRIIEGIGDVFGKLYDDLGFGGLLGKTKQDIPWNEVLKNCVLSRIANPVSKRRTASLLEEDYGIKISLEKIYRMMDRVAENIDGIKGCVRDSTLSLFKERVDVLFFDVTTLYFESVIQDELRDFGFSKDCKFKETQVVLALITTREGLPIGYEVFPGNTYEGHTLIEVVNQLKAQYSVGNVLIVADRAMFSDDNLSYMENEGINYIVAARLKSLSKEIKEDIVNCSDFNMSVIGNDISWTKEYEYNGRRLIASYTQARAKKDAADRQRLVERLLKRAKDGKVKIKDLIPNYGTKKYITINSKEQAVINEAKIEEESRWDGLHGIITNVREDSALEILSRYQGLWQIEDAFRINKHDLKMRPIYHWTPERIKAHIAICFLAFTLAKQSVYRIKVQQIPMSFEQIRNELLHAQVSIVRDIKTNKRYGIPSQVTINQKKIYQTFGLKRGEVPYALC